MMITVKPVKIRFKFEVRPDLSESLGRLCYCRQVDFSLFDKETDNCRNKARNGVPFIDPVHPAVALRDEILSAFPSGFKSGDYHIAYRKNAYRLFTGESREKSLVYAYLDGYKRLDWAPLSVQKALWT